MAQTVQILYLAQFLLPQLVAVAVELILRILMLAAVALEQ
jgi:hypothetical protein